MRPAAETRWADLALCAVTARSPGRRQVPVPACAVTRAGVWIGLAETIDARHARAALLERGVAAVSPAKARTQFLVPGFPLAREWAECGVSFVQQIGFENAPQARNSVGSPHFFSSISVPSLRIAGVSFSAM